jgi:hypothetical protein
VERHERDKGKKKSGIKIRRKLSLFPPVTYNAELEVLDKIEGYLAPVVFRTDTEYVSASGFSV